MKHKKKRYRAILFTLLAIFSALIPLPLKISGLIGRWEGITYDYRMRLAFGGQKASEEVVVILIDEASLKAMDPLVGRWPWPRSVHGDVIEFLTIGGAKLIIYDILFTEKSQADQDIYLANATLESNRVIHALNLIKEQEKGTSKDMPADLSDKHSLKNVRMLKPDKYNDYVIPYRELYIASSGLGVVEFEPDMDGVYRRTSLIKSYGDIHFPSLSLAGFLKNLKDYNIIQGRNILTIQSKDYTAHIPYYNSKYMVKFYGQIDTYSMSGVLASIQAIRRGELENMLISPEEFKGKVVFVGASAVGLEDLKPTPMGPTTPGVFIHAFAYSNLIQKDFLRPLPPYATYLIALVLSLFVSLFMSFGIKRGAFLSAFFIFAYVPIALFLFWQNVVAEMVYPILSGVSNFVLTLSFLALKEEREKLILRKTFERYVSPAILSELEKGLDEALSGRTGSRVELTILFSDIRGFTDISEKLPPEKVVELLNIYFDHIVEVIFQKGGTIDKFIGDAILAFWGAPVRMQDHAKRAVECALQIRRSIKELNIKLSNLGLPQIQSGIGINTAEVVLGNVGSKKRMDYTIIGDGVNLASRLEGLTKFYGAEIIISESTAERLEGGFILRPLDLVRVKGKRKPIRIYQVMEDDRTLADIHTKAFELYLAKDWSGAKKLFQEVLKLKPQDKVAFIFIQRCETFMQNPPPEDWDGVWEFKEK